METSISFRKCCLSTLLLLFITHKVASFSRTGFSCSKEDTSNLPELPEAFSANVRANFLMESYTADIKYAVNKKEKKELFDIKTADRRVQYILRGDQKVALKITFKEDEYPDCVVEKAEVISEIMDSKDTGPSGILQKTISVMKNPGNKFKPRTDTQDAIFAQLWEGCLGEPRINVSFSIAEENWKHPYGSTKKVNYIGRGEAQIDNVFMTAYFSNFNPTTPDNSLFQPPEDVYCEGLKSTEEFPVIQDFFSYNAEIVTYVSAAALAPIISHRTVYYDYPAGIARVDFYDALAEDADIFAPVIAQEKSVIHDFNAGVQYSFDMLRGKCTPDSFKSTFSVISYVETKDNKMLNGKEYLWLDNAKLSYNGQFPVRGVKADVYTSIKVDPKTNKDAVVSWYFSSRETRVVEDVNVEQNVLLRMSVRPKNGYGKQGVVVINFYDFVNEEPSALSYDLTRCYNETSSKLLVLTFPTNPLLRGSEKLIGMLAHIAIRTTTGVSKQRIAVREVALNDKYLFVEFYLLDTPSKDSKETSLDDAVKKLEKAISDGKITLSVPVGKELIKLSPEPDGLNVFAGDRIRQPSVIGYKEGSVISMAIGMLLLGFLLGGVTLNLIMSRKFGVSLFQKAKYGSGGPFSDSHESSM